MEYNWFEDLPDSCPPLDATPCNGLFYRVAIGNPATNNDFFSQRKLAPDKTFKGEGIDECIVRALSVFSDLPDAERLLKLPKFRKANIVKIELSEKDGKIKRRSETLITPGGEVLFLMYHNLKL